MSSRGLPTLDFDLRQRRADRLCAGLLSSLALMAPWLAAGSFGYPAALALSLMSGLCTLLAFHRAGWRGVRFSVVRITWRSDGCWVLTDASGVSVEVALSSESRMSPVAVWLRWRPLDRTMGSLTQRALLLTPMDVPVGDFRRLLIRLRMDQSASDQSECEPTAAGAVASLSP